MFLLRFLFYFFLLLRFLDQIERHRDSEKVHHFKPGSECPTLLMTLSLIPTQGPVHCCCHGTELGSCIIGTGFKAASFRE